MVCLGILWNSMENNLGDALEDLSSYGEILDCFAMNLGDKYEKFVRDIYAQDEIADWKVDKKIDTMFKCNDNRKIAIVIIDVETSDISYHPFKKRNVFTNLENMKTNIRKKYSEKVEYYFFDNVLHVTDDTKEFEADWGVVSTYIEMGIKKEPIDYSNQKGKVLRKED